MTEETKAKKRKAGRSGFIKNMFLVLLSLGLLIFILQACYACAQEYNQELQTSINSFKEEQMSLEFLVLERNEESIVSELFLYNMEGEEISSVIIEQPGSELFVEFIHYNSIDGDESFVFPYCVYSDIIPVNSGFFLFPYYTDSEGLRLLSSDVDEATAKYIYELAEPVKQNNFEGLRNYKHYALHDVADVLPFQVNRRYRIVYRMNGGMEVLEL